VGFLARCSILSFRDYPSSIMSYTSIIWARQKYLRMWYYKWCIELASEAQGWPRPELLSIVDSDHDQIDIILCQEMLDSATSAAYRKSACNIPLPAGG
jgi:hypothetical protein